MDSFIDKFAQRKNAQEMIRANAMAEAEEKKKMEARLSEYEQVMQEMRRCSLLNMENAEKVKEVLAASLAKIEQVQKQDVETPVGTAGEERALLEKLAEQVTKLTEQMATLAEKQEIQTSQMTALAEKQEIQTSQVTEFVEKQQMQTAQTKTIEELLHASDEFCHKESVKVYRNVQAVIEGALPKQTEEITAALKNEERKTPVGMIVLWVLTFAAAAANVAIEVLEILGYL